jgi:DNA repair exonuclease SbcCD ATPase subunit
MVDAVSSPPGSTSLLTAVAPTAQEALQRVLASGSLEFAMAQNFRDGIEVLEAQIASAVEKEKARNDQRKELMNQIAACEYAMPSASEEYKAELQAERTRYQGELESLNGESSLANLDMQYLMQLRAQVLEKYSSFIAKIGKVNDDIIRNW